MQSHICLNCHHEFTGKFCNNCGEKVYTSHDKSVPHLFEEAFHFFTHFEGKFFNTLKTIAVRPGQLSLDYCNGIRKKYFKPLSFFLLLVILYLLFPVFEGLNMHLKFFRSHSVYGTYATEISDRVMQEHHITQEELAEIFHHKGEKTSKFLLFIVIPAVALVSWLLGYRKRRMYFDHFIFSVEALSNFLLWGFLILPLVIVLLRLVSQNINIPEAALGAAIIVIYLYFVIRMSRKFFAFSWWYNIIYCFFFIVFTAFFIEYVYKFILFNVTIRLV